MISNRGETILRKRCLFYGVAWAYIYWYSKIHGGSGEDDKVKGSIGM